jgi:hypothetical protein
MDKSINHSIIESLPVSAIKPKKVQLGMKHKSQHKAANEAVLHFIDNHANNENHHNQNNFNHLLSF